MLQETTVPDTCAWLFREPEWERWLNQQDPPDTVLAITGSPGTGKSHLVFSVYQAQRSEKAAKDASRRTCVAQFFFREQNESLSSFTNGVISVIDQVAEQIPELCEAIKFSRYVQQRIADKTEEIAPNILYAEHLLARLNTLGREGAVLRSLEKPLPLTLYQLYEVTTAECFRRTESSHRALVSKLLQWILYSLRPIKLKGGLSLLRFWSNESGFDLEEIPEPFSKLLQIGDPDSGAETRAKIQSRGGWGTAIDELEKAHKASQSDDLYQDGKLPIKFRERAMRGRRSGAHRQMFLTCSNFIQPEHPGIKSTGQGVQEYAVNHVLHHWRDIEAEHLHGSFARIQEEELRTTFYHDERFVDFFFERLRSWAALLLDVKVPLSAEAAEWWTLIAERPRDCLLQLANSSANDALRICGKGTILEEQARENFASAVGDVSGALPAKQAVLGLDGLFEDIDLGSNGYHWLVALQSLYKQA
ncbi:NACHT and TPR domain-containing protein [Colletotrichum sp. SAR 10_96]|nr:NACHT and TPR domain-containing protein [Colletotrichum sp. SAR 10_96]